MAASTHPTTNYPSTHFLESCGAIPFHLSSKRVVLISRHRGGRHEWFLSKGRRNVRESRLQAALREAREETGYLCTALPVTLATRLTPQVEEVGGTRDRVRVFDGVVEPFMLSVRELGPGNVKVIWWFVAAVDEGVEPAPVSDVETEEAALFGYEEALRMLTYQGDREILQRAIEVVRGEVDV